MLEAPGGARWHGLDLLHGPPKGASVDLVLPDRMYMACHDMKS